MEASARVLSRKTFSVLVTRDPGELIDHQPGWEDLARSALDPNVFYEPWIFLPAVKAFGRQSDLTFVLVYASKAENGGPPELCGFFPLDLLRRYHRLPVRCFSFWRHKYCFLGTPLVRASEAYETLSAFFDWLSGLPRGVGMMDFGYIHGEGSFARVLREVLGARRLPYFLVESFARAAFRTAADAETHFKQAVSRRRRHGLRRKERRLAERGALRYVTLTAEGDIERWISNFLHLEASGWKGQEGTALASHPADRDFFQEVAREGFRRRQLIMQAVELDGRPIAQHCEFESGIGSFSFKIAYDENYARYSPGVLLELERVRYMHRRRKLAWIDSCAEPDSYLNALSPDRVSIKSILVCLGGIRDISMGNTLTWIKKAKTALRRASGESLKAGL